MARKSFVKKYKNQLMVAVAIVLALLMLIPAWIRSGTGGTVVSLSELKRYVIVPKSENETLILLFVGGPKECPICPQVINNVTQAINIVKTQFEKQLNGTIVFKIIQCNGFPNCSNKQARINVIWYKVPQVPILIIATNKLQVPIDPTGLGPDKLARLIVGWITVLKHAWLPPPTGKYVIYFYDDAHKSALIDTIKAEALQKGFKFVEMGCKQYPTNCTNTTVLSTMMLLGLRPQNLPFVMVIKNGKVVVATMPTTFDQVNKILKALQN